MNRDVLVLIAPHDRDESVPEQLLKTRPPSSGDLDQHQSKIVGERHRFHSMTIGLQCRTGVEIPGRETGQLHQRPNGCNRESRHYPTRINTTGIGFGACLRAMALLDGDVSPLNPDQLFLSRKEIYRLHNLDERIFRGGAEVFRDDGLK